MYQRAGLPFYKAPIRHNIAAGATANDADVGGGVRIHPAKAHMGDRIRRHGDRVDTILGLQRRMGCFSLQGCHHADAGGGRQNCRADLAVGIQHIGLVGMNPAVVQLLGPFHEVFLAGGKNYLNIPMGKVFLLNLPQGLENLHHAGEIIAAEDRGAVGVDGSVRLHGDLFILTGRDRVHMRRKQDRFPRHISR